MKKLLTFALVGLSTLTFAGDKGNGGDPYEVYARNFSDSQKIEAATKLVEEKVYKSNLPIDFSDEVVNEMISLKRNDRYRYIGNVIVLPGADQSFGHHVPSEEGQFLGLGAFTQNKKGAQVYFTERTLSHLEGDFAKLVLHEVAHHVLPQFLAKDEGFIERFVKEIWLGNVSDLILNSIKYGYYLPRGGFTRERLIAAFAVRMVTEEKVPFVYTNPIFLYQCDYKEDELACYEYLIKEKDKLPLNLWDKNMNDYVSNDYFDPFFSELEKVNAKRLLLGALQKLGYEFIDGDHFCVKEEGAWFFYKCLEERKIKDIIKK